MRLTSELIHSDVFGAGVRWVAVRHGEDHVHIVAMLARQDRTTSPRVATEATAQIRANPAAAADAAWAASDTLHVAAAALGSSILRQAADAYDHAARAPLRAHPGSVRPPGSSARS